MVLRRGLAFFFFFMIASVAACSSGPGPVWRADRRPSPQIYHLHRGRGVDHLQHAPAVRPADDDRRIRAAGDAVQAVLQRFEYLNDLDMMIVNVRLTIRIPVEA